MPKYVFVNDQTGEQIATDCDRLEDHPHRGTKNDGPNGTARPIPHPEAGSFRLMKKCDQPSDEKAADEVQPAKKGKS